MAFKPTHDQTYPKLSDKEASIATTELFHFPKYQKINRKYVDPRKVGEPRYVLVSFIKPSDLPLKNHLNEITDYINNPDETKNGLLLKNNSYFLTERRLHGIAKIRGVCETIDDAQIRAREIIQDVDSTNSIFTCEVGKPFPLVVDGTNLSSEVDEIDISNKTEQAISQNVRRKRQEDQREMKTIMDREENLKADVNEDKEGTEEEYITNRVKLAHLRYSVNAHAEKGAECMKLKDDCIKWLLVAKAKSPEYEKNYLQRYNDSRKAAHIPDTDEMQYFSKYMKDDIEELNVSYIS